MSSTIISWGLTLALVAGVVYVYKPDIFRRLTAQAQETKAAVVESSNKPANKKPKPKKNATAKVAVEENVGSASETQGSKKRKMVSTPTEKPTVASKSEEKPQQSASVQDDGLSDKDFAKQFAQAQSGSKLQVPQKQQTSKKDRRASKATPATTPDPSGFSTEASSTTGRDADDDLTPAESPPTRPHDGPTTKAGDVSDMLEAPAAKPNVLRLTDVTNESKAKKPANKAFEPVLSKKKRNEKQRKEEQRLAREEADRIHEAKKQEQLRTARLAAGTSNQTKANNFAAKANAWQSGTSSTVKAAPAASTEPLLDTFDPAASTAGPAHGAVHTQSIGANTANDLRVKAGENAAAALTTSASREGLSAGQRQEYASELSEEDQMNILQQQEQEDAWESVTNKKSKRKGKQDTESTSGASSPARAAPIPTKPQTVNNKVNGNTKKAEGLNRFQSFEVKIGSGLQDAEWEA